MKMRQYNVMLDIITDSKCIYDISCRVIAEDGNWLCIEDTMGVTYNINKANLIYYSIRKIEVDK